MSGRFSQLYFQSYCYIYILSFCSHLKFSKAFSCFLSFSLDNPLFLFYGYNFISSHWILDFKKPFLCVLYNFFWFFYLIWFLFFHDRIISQLFLKCLINAENLSGNSVCMGFTLGLLVEDQIHFIETSLILKTNNRFSSTDLSSQGGILVSSIDSKRLAISLWQLSRRRELGSRGSSHCLVCKLVFTLLVFSTVSYPHTQCL